MAITLKKAMGVTGFEISLFIETGDTCYRCGRSDRRLYWRTTDHYYGDGDCFCRLCVKREAEDILSIIKIECITCGEIFDGWPHQKGGECFGCFCDRQDMEAL